MPSFSIGDVVCLKSGGPNMTVIVPAIKDDATRCYCVWFDTAHKAEPFGHNFKTEALVKVA